MVRRDRSIKGVNVCGHIFNIIAYADDATVLCNDLDSARRVKGAFDVFSKYSGLRLNESKTEICGIGVKRGVDIALCGMKSVNLLTDSVKVLGVYFSYNEEISKEKNFGAPSSPLSQCGNFQPAFKSTIFQFLSKKSNVPNHLLGN